MVLSITAPSRGVEPPTAHACASASHRASVHAAALGADRARLTCSEARQHDAGADRRPRNQVLLFSELHDGPPKLASFTGQRKPPNPNRAPDITAQSQSRRSRSPVIAINRAAAYPGSVTNGMRSSGPGAARRRQSGHGDCRPVDGHTPAVVNLQRQDVAPGTQSMDPTRQRELPVSRSERDRPAGCVDDTPA